MAVLCWLFKEVSIFGHYMWVVYGSIISVLCSGIIIQAEIMRKTV